MSTEHGTCPNVVTGNEGTSYCALAESSVLALRKQLALRDADVIAAAGELLVNIKEAVPGSTVRRLMIANAILRDERSKLIAERRPLLTPIPKQGMKVNGTRILRYDGRGYSEMRRQMAGHLEELARRYYAGEVCVVDEFLQLYCIGDEERKGVTP